MIIILIFAILITSLFFLNVKIKIRYNYIQSNFAANISVGGIKIKKKRRSKSKTKIYYRTVKHILRKLKTEYLLINILVGSEDAVATVFATQLARNLFAAAYSVIRHTVNKKSEIFVKIMPAFAQNVFSAELECIINVRSGHIIIAYARRYFDIFKKKIRRRLK